MRSKSMNCLIMISLLSACAFGVSAEAGPQPTDDSLEIVDLADTTHIEINGTLHTPAEILALMEQSPLTYILKNNDSLPSKTDTLPYYRNIYYLHYGDDGYIMLSQYSPGETVTALVDSGEIAYKAKNYENAISFYQKALELYPDFHQLLVWIGQNYEYLGFDDSASYYYNLAIKRNKIDYDAHWFLGDLLWTQHDTAGAIHELTLAHALNPGHPLVKNRLKELRDEIGRPWREWEFNPIYAVENTDSGVFISANLYWMPYAMVKAFWRFEPDYAQKMGGGPVTEVIGTILEEKEALAAWLILHTDSTGVIDDSLAANINKIWTSGDIVPMYYHEIVARRYPTLMQVLPDDQLLEICAYIDKYH